MLYFPLETVKKFKEQFDFKDNYDYIKDRYNLDGSLEEFSDYLFSDDFFNPDYKGKFKKYNDDIMYNRETNALMNLSMTNPNRVSDWSDYSGAFNRVLEFWESYKMVYKVDNEFFHAIKDTENIIWGADVFNNFPFNTFYVDLSEVDNIGKFQGAFVYFAKTNHNTVIMSTFLLEDDFTFYSGRLLFDGGITEEFDLNTINKGTTKESFAKLTPFGELLERAPDNDYRAVILKSIFQLMTFIVNNDECVTENPTTKQTYKPRKTIRNKFSEVRMWDVGVRFGKAIKSARKEYERRKNESDNQNTNKTHVVRPHIRRAHWHTYRYGKEKKLKKVVWQPPIYVLGDKETIPVTIREIKL